MNKGKSAIRKLEDLGQSIWLDYIRRDMLVSGELQKFVEDDGLRGVTSNPSIFFKAISGSDDYTTAINSLVLEGKSPVEIYESLAFTDIQETADVFRPVYDESGGLHGFVSLEVSPHLARDTDGTIEQAREYWKAVDRPNVLIKVPATKEGLPAIRRLISEGININVKLLFGLDRYREVAEAYINGIDDRLQRGQSVDRISSVASFFLSRIDVLVDPLLDDLASEGGEKGKTADSLKGEVAIASAKIAYQIYKEIFNGDRFIKSAEKGARPQRVLWASTSTKNPDYSDVRYVEALIGPETINTVPLETLNAYRDHGEPASRLEEGLEQSREVLKRLDELGIDLKEVTQQLVEEGIEKFNKPYDKLVEELDDRLKRSGDEPVDVQRIEVRDDRENIDRRIEMLEKEDFVGRMWRKDPSLWKSDPETRTNISNALGWLHVAEKMVSFVPHVERFATSIRTKGFRHVVHMGMGGSSLAPLTLAECFDSVKDRLPITVLDTTDPNTILRLDRSLPLAETLFIVASKSGTTAETRAFDQYFYHRLRSIKGSSAGDNFVVITDPGTPLADLAKERKYLRTFLNFRDIGGRYSALSCFGLVPAALMGLDIGELLERALVMMHCCNTASHIGEQSGVALGAAIGELARAGRDKLTYLMPPPLSTLGMWLEQLIAESTGKENEGILPVTGEDLGEPSVYGQDRNFISFEMNGTGTAMPEQVRSLMSAGHPVTTIRLGDTFDIGQEFFRWEIATATAGAVLGINPFDQPNVKESKDNTNKLLDEVRERGHLEDDPPVLTESPLAFYYPERHSSPVDLMREFLGKCSAGDYVAFQAYLTETSEVGRALQEIRLRVRDALGVATTVGYGPRFLHSTGQFHKGGPNTGLFVQLTAKDGEDIEIPGESYGFGILKKAQAKGDLDALKRHHRRVIRIDLGDNPETGLSAFGKLIDEALRR